MTEIVSWVHQHQLQMYWYNVPAPVSPDPQTARTAATTPRDIAWARAPFGSLSTSLLPLLCRLSLPPGGLPRGLGSGLPRYGFTRILDDRASPLGCHLFGTRLLRSPPSSKVLRPCFRLAFGGGGWWGGRGTRVGREWSLPQACLQPVLS